MDRDRAGLSKHHAAFAWNEFTDRKFGFLDPKSNSFRFLGGVFGGLGSGYRAGQKITKNNALLGNRPI